MEIPSCTVFSEEVEMRKKLLFFVNPKAGQLELRVHLIDMIDIFTAGGYDVTVHTTQSPRDLTESIARDGSAYDLVVCAGGDGTLNEAVSGLMTLKRRPALGYIPGGTVNDVASTLGIPKDPVEAARAILSGTPKAIDIGSFGADRWFTYVAGFGAFTDVAYKTPQQEKRVLGRLAYLLKGAQSLAEIKPIPVRMTVGGRTIKDEVLLGLVCSTTSVGGFKAAHADDLGIRLDDGLSEVIVAKSITNVQDLNALGTLLVKREFDPRFFHTFQTDHVEFQFPALVDWTLDGEFGGSRDCVEIQNHKQAVEILVP